MLLSILLACTSTPGGPLGPIGDDTAGSDSADTGAHSDDHSGDSGGGGETGESGESGDSGGGDTGADVVDPSTIQHKLLFGYQGWFTTACDDAGVGWTHWAGGSTPDPENVSFDAWPDLSEFGADELCPTTFRHADGSVAGLYSASDPRPVDRHFAWMQEHDLDGVMLQRFGSELRDPRFLALRDQVARNVRDAAEAHGRSFAVMYDISGMADDTVVDELVADWRHLVDDLGLLESPAYLHEEGRPVVAVWGFGFTDRPGDPADVSRLLASFRAGDRYQAWVLGGVPAYWRTRTADSKSDAAWADAYLAWDAISPWAVGRYADEGEADRFRRDLVEPDLAATRAARVGYMPVVFPGFSWTNLTDRANPLNQIPRDGGRFYWRQVYNVTDAGATMVFNAMFDEVDEGTAMMKVAARAGDLPTTGTFLSLDADGYVLPSDWYLRLGGQATRVLHGELAPSEGMPLDPGDSGASWYTWVVEHGYAGILGRAADEGGAAAYVAALGEGLPVTEFTDALWSSEEWATNRAGLPAETLATDLYLGILERDPDPEGLAGTVEAIEAGRGAERAADMLESDEARGLWGGR